LSHGNNIEGVRNILLRRIFLYNGDRVTGGRTKLHNKKLQKEDMGLQYIIYKEMINVYTILVGEPELQSQLGR
jgi:hypothetical protein